MSGTVENLIQGAGYLYVAALGTSEPADSSLHNPPASGSWTNLGFTNGGLSLTFEQDYADLAVDQLVDHPGRRIVRRDLVFATSLAEPTLENLKVALNGGVTATGAAGAGASEFKNFQPVQDPTGEPTYTLLLFDGLAPNGRPRRVIVRKALQVGNVGASYQKDGQTLFPVEFRAHYVSSSVAPYKIIDQTADAA